MPLHLSQQPRSQLPYVPSGTSQPETSAGTLSRGPRKRTRQKSRKKEAAHWFIQHAPKATEWRKRQIELKLETAQQYEKVIRAFTDGANATVRPASFKGDKHSENELIRLAEKFALLTKESFANAKLQRSFAGFQAVILLSLCEVLRNRGVTYETIDRIIQPIADREYDRRKLILSARWINSVIVGLVSCGWTIYRATELFFIGMSSEPPRLKLHLFPPQTHFLLPTLPISMTMRIPNRSSSILKQISL